MIDRLILDYTKKQWINSSPYHMEDFKVQLLAEILKVIGEDETYEDLVLEDNAMHKAVWEGRYIRNKLRAEQRAKAEELFNEKEK